jgi:hypothetical protein
VGRQGADISEIAENSAGISTAGWLERFEAMRVDLQ